jgi:hypothetical protein
MFIVGSVQKEVSAAASAAASISRGHKREACNFLPLNPTPSTIRLVSLQRERSIFHVT